MTSDNSPARTLRSLDDVVAFVYTQFGFVPMESIVLLGWSGKSAMQARADLPRSPAELALLQDSMVEPVARHGTRQAVLVAWSADADMVDRTFCAVEQWCASVGIQVHEAWRVHDGRWWSHGDGPDHPGTAYDVSTHPFMAQSVFDGMVIHESREELALSLQPVPELVERVEARVVQGRPRWTDDERRRQAARWVRAVDVHVRVGTFPDLHEWAGLLSALQVPHVLDDMGESIAPDLSGEHMALWREGLRCAPEGMVAPVAALLAFSAWLSGQGAVAACAVDVGLIDDPFHALLITMRDVLQSAVPPSAYGENRQAS